MPLHITEILILLLLIITFGFSCFEKLYNWKSTITFYKNHFKDTILKNTIPLSVSFIVILEILATVAMSIGCYKLLTSDESKIALYGLLLSAFTLLILLVGQRIAKDYQGSMSLVVYFIPTIFGIYILTN